MKRIVVILLILLLVGGLAGCGGGTSDLVGTWDIEGEFGSLSFTFNEDGTGVEFFGKIHVIHSIGLHRLAI